MSAEASTSKLAPEYPIPSPLVELAGIEYPGRVRNTHKALASLGGLPKLSNNLDKTIHKEVTSPQHAIEYSLNSANPFAHPVPAFVTHTGNVVLKVTKRRRKVPKVDAEGNVVESGVFKAEVCGVCTKTVRFRGEWGGGGLPKLKVARGG
jgi:general transcription factor 3C polypeptide 5 (transcription factor C subunit 1)